MLKRRFIKQLVNSLFDLVPIIVVVLIFQVLVIGKSIADVDRLITGLLFVVLGLCLFIQGIELSLLPLGESMAYDFAKKGSLFWLLGFAFCLGFSAAIAEPALIVLVEKAALSASNHHQIDSTETASAHYALGLRFTVAISVGLAILIGVLRILKGWPVYYPVFCAYAGIALITPFAPKDIIGIAYDSGSIATATITVPIVTALGVGLASAIKGRNPITDGFGLVVFASLMPMIFVMIYGIAYA